MTPYSHIPVDPNCIDISVVDFSQQITINCKMLPRVTHAHRRQTHTQCHVAKLLNFWVFKTILGAGCVLITNNRQYHFSLNDYTCNFSILYRLVRKIYLLGTFNYIRFVVVFSEELVYWEEGGVYIVLNFVFS